MEFRKQTTFILFYYVKILSKLSKIVIKFCTFPHILKDIIRVPPDSLSSAVFKDVWGNLRITRVNWTVLFELHQRSLLKLLRT